MPNGPELGGQKTEEDITMVTTLFLPPTPARKPRTTRNLLAMRSMSGVANEGSFMT